MSLCTCVTDNWSSSQLHSDIVQSDSCHLSLGDTHPRTKLRWLEPWRQYVNRSQGDQVRPARNREHGRIAPLVLAEPARAEVHQEAAHRARKPAEADHGSNRGFREHV